MMSRTATSIPASNAGWGILDSSNLGGANRFLLNRKLPSQPTIQDAPMQTVNTSPGHYFAPPPKRSALKNKKQSTSPSTSNEPLRRVGFCNSVDVRISLAVDAGLNLNRWWTANEIQSMRATAMERHSPLRHSSQAVSSTIQLQQKLVVSSPPPPAAAPSTSSTNGPPNRSHIPRAHSAAAQFHSIPSSKINPPNPLDIRYQQLISEMDREIFIRNKDRRYSTRRRLHHYCKVLDDIDRQVDEGYMMINVGELANVSLVASGDVVARALERARKEATIAQAIVLIGSSRRLLM